MVFLGLLNYCIAMSQDVLEREFEIVGYRVNLDQFVTGRTCHQFSCVYFSIMLMPIWMILLVFLVPTISYFVFWCIQESITIVYIICIYCKRRIKYYYYL